MSTELIRISGLNKLDFLELTDEFPDAEVEFEEQALPGGKHGELVTTVAIVVGAAAIRLLAAWMMKSRDRNKIKKTIKIVGADGSVREETIDIDISSSKAPEADVIKSIASLVDIDPKTII